MRRKLPGPVRVRLPVPRRFRQALAAVALLAGQPAAWPGEPAANPEPDPRGSWRRGNLHAHTLWSAGDDFPETVALWYRDHGYDFLAITDHNTLLEGEKWTELPGRHRALTRLRILFGEEAVEARDSPRAGLLQVRLKTLEEFREKVEAPDRFLLIMGNEITDAHSVHLIALHPGRVIPPAGGSASERGRMIRDNVANVDAHRESTGRNTHAILAHPNSLWAVTAEMMADAENLRFFEVYNGHPFVNTEGDAHRPGADRMWDIALALRLSRGIETLLYGVASDGAHQYFGGRAGPGRGWVRVRTPRLTPDAILDALDRGDFYASTGVALREIRREGNRVLVEIEPRDGVEFLTEYVGTRRGADLAGQPARDADGNRIPNATRVYGDDIGEVFHRSAELRSHYDFTGDELYVRVRITSTAEHADPVTGRPLGGRQRAWGQPMRIAPETP